MNTNPKDRKQLSPLRKQNRKFFKNQSPAPKLLLNENTDLLKIWSEEIKVLRANNYISLPAACDALIAAVVQRFSSGGSNAELQNALKLYVENDPDLLEQINNLLIKKH